MPGASDLPDQLEALGQRLVGSNVELYRHVALYLQVLRQVLPQRVRQACFHLATQVHPQRYIELPAERRRQLLAQIDALVSRCSSLLTVEQLVILAGQISRERRRPDPPELQDPGAAIAPSPGIAWSEEEGGEVASDAAALPPGSVQLGLALPLSGAVFPPPIHRLPDTAEPAVPPDGESISNPARGPEPHAVSQPDAEPDPDAAPAREQPDPLDPPDLADDASDLWQSGRLPEEPAQVLAWMDGLEGALARRLRNLSHAINVELLRGGLSHTLLPVSLLEAVLTGQLDTLAAPANLLRLPLPFEAPRSGPPAQVMAVLLRCVELELEEPRLRTCRRRLQQHRQEVRRMAQQFRRLQRRLSIHQAEQLWLQDLPPPPAPGG